MLSNFPYHRNEEKKNCHGGISMKDRRTHEELRRMAGVEPIITVIISGRLWWYVHVMRTGWRNVWSLDLKAEDHKKDMVRECRSGYGRTGDRQRRRPWSKAMEKECHEKEVQPYRKTDYKSIIYIICSLSSTFLIYNRHGDLPCNLHFSFTMCAFCWESSDKTIWNI